MTDEQKTLERLRAIAGSWRGSEAQVSLDRRDAIALGLAIAPAQDLVLVPARELCRAVDALSVAQTAETLSEVLVGDQTPADENPSETPSEDEPTSEQPADAPADEKPAKKTRKR